MHAIKKKIVTDENSRPVAVQIDYEDWLEIEGMLGLEGAEKKAVDLSRYSGVVKLTEEPLEYQERMRGEWP